ncbi:hypothetical protein TGMAS_260830 [Toxoplasma gondii MAS]|uniref:AMP-activated protein kinase glycogen-binding domain-containing protein n=1 Tax=Toxoplasma gondii MAS TaxID=943118 RepID=A0A086QRR5_TOXGO|nr:hypothetical protein TGMAS_260830 [Toxoplasma gondii MAS]
MTIAVRGLRRIHAALLQKEHETCDFWSDTGYREDTVTTSPGARDTTETIAEEAYDSQTGQSDYSQADSIHGISAAKNALESTRKNEHQNEDRRLLQWSSAECESPKADQEQIRRENAAKTLQQRWRQRCLSAALDFEALVCCIRHIRTLAAVEIQRIYRGSRLRRILKEELHCLILTLREEDVVQADGEGDASRERGRGDREGLRSVELIGAFGDHPWEERIRMRFCSVRRCYTAARPYTVGRHLFKFIVDNIYRCSSQYAQVADPDGNMNNCIDVSEPVPPALCLVPRFPWPLARSFRCGGPPSVVDLCGTLSKHVFSPQAEQGEENRKTDAANDSGDSMRDRWRQESKNGEKSCSKETRSNRNVPCGKPATVPVSKDQTGGHNSPRLHCHGNGEAELGDGKTEADGVETCTRENFVESLEVQTSSQNVDTRTGDQPAEAQLGDESLRSSITLPETTRRLSLSLPLRSHTGRCQKVNAQEGQEDNEVRIVCSLETPLSRVPTLSVLPEAAERINSRDGEEPAGHPAGVSEEGSVQRLLCGHTDEENPEMLADLDDVVAPLLRFPRWSALGRRERHERSSRILPALWRTALSRKSSVENSPPGRGCNAATNVSVSSFPAAKEKCKDCGSGHSPSDGSQTSRSPALPAWSWNTTRVWSPSPRQVAARIQFGGDAVGESFREGDCGCESLFRRAQAPDKASHSNPSCFHGFEAEDKRGKDMSFDTLHEGEKHSTFSSPGSVQSASDTRDSLICTSEQPLEKRMRHRQGDSKRRAQSLPACHHRQNTVSCLVETVTMLQPRRRGSLIAPDSDTTASLDSGGGVSVYLNEPSMDATEALALADVASVSQSSEESRGRQNTTNVLVFDGTVSALVVPGLEGGGVASKSCGSRVADLNESKREAHPDAVHTLGAKGSVSLDRNPSLSYAVVSSEGHRHSSEAGNESSCVLLVGPRPSEGEGEQLIESDPFAGASDGVEVCRRSGASAEAIDGSEMQSRSTQKQRQETSACSSSDGLSLGTAVLRKQTSFSDLPVSRLREEIQRQKEKGRSDILIQGKGRFSGVSLPANISPQCGELDGMNRLTKEPFQNRKKAASADWSVEFAATHMEERCEQFVEHESKLVGWKREETQEKESVRGKDQSGNALLVVEEAKLRRPCGRLPPLALEKLLFTAALKIPEKCIHSAISQSMPIAWLRGIQEETTSKVLCRVAALRRPTPSDSPHPCGMQELGGGR